MQMRRFAVFFALMAGLSQAQDIRGMISGTVTDPQGAHVVGATVIVTNTDTNVSTPLTTNSSGFYEAPLLMPGPYQVTVEAPGFKKINRSNLILAMRGQLKIDIQLEVGGGERIDHHQRRISHSRHQHREHGKGADHPRNHGSADHDERHRPDGASGARGGESGDDAVPDAGHGRRVTPAFLRRSALGQNEWSIDGAPNLGSGGIAFTPFTDQIAEYKIDTTSFDASVGHSIGLNIAFSTKSGTNSLHGSGTEQYWNTRWNAASFFVKQKYFQNIAAANAAGNSALAEPVGIAADAARRAFERLRVHARRARFIFPKCSTARTSSSGSFPTRGTRPASRPDPAKSPIRSPPWRSGRATSRTCWRSIRNTRSTIR